MKHLKIIICSLFALWNIFPATAQIPLSDSRVVVRNEEKVNTAHLEYSPAFYREGIVFITNRHESLKATAEDTRLGQNIMALYESKRDEDGFLQKSELFSSELLERVHQGPMTFNRTGETIYFTRNVLDKKDKAKDGLRKLMVYESKKEGNAWSEPLLLPFNNQECNTMHPVIGATDSILIFASDRPGGFGGMDLYRVVKEFDEWGNPENLGETINTGGNEVFPFFHTDGTLYFASDNHGSLGGLDMFLVRQEGGNWTSPVNLKPPFNTEKDDFGFIIDQDNRNGYFSSNRLNGKGGDDIYSFEYFGEPTKTEEEKKKDMVAKNPQITDVDGNPIEGVVISWLNLDNVFLGKTENGEESIRLVPNGKPGEFTLSVGDENGFDGQATTDESGSTNVTVDKNGNYIFKIEKDGFIPKQIIVKPGTDWSALDFTMQRSTDCVALSGYVRVQGKAEGQGNTEVVFVNTLTSEETKIYTDPDGSYVYCLPCNQTYSMYAVKNGIYAPTQIISFKSADCGEGKNYVQDFTFPVDPGTSLAEGDIIELKNIYFNFNDAGIRPDAKKDLEVVLQILQNTPDMAIELGSHTDARGSARYNQKLSQRRSDSVRKWLTSKGIGEGRTAAVGYGETKVRNGCTNNVPCTESEHQENRRTEFKIIALDSPLLGQGIQNINSAEQKNIPVNVSPSDNAANAYRAISINQEGSSSAFTVIAGTFGQRANAQKRWQQLQDIGCETAIIIQKTDGMFIVEAKYFADRGEAESFGQRLESREGIGTYVKAN